MPWWIEAYLELTAGAPAPMIFKKNAALFGVSAALSKRCWIETPNGPLFPNYLALLVGDPGVGKGPAINPIFHMLRKIDTVNSILEAFESIHMGPGDCTVAGLFDEFVDEKSHKTFSLDGETHSFQQVIIVAEELSAFMHNVDTQMMGYLIKFLNGDPHSQRLRGKGETMHVENPVLSIIGGVQPQVLNMIFPAQAFGMGLAARALFVYSEDRVKVSPFGNSKYNKDLEHKLTEDLRHITRLAGRFKFTEEAEQFVENWWMERSDHDHPNHPKLTAYNSKRIFPFLRMCMIHSASREDNLVITLDHAENALADLYEIENVMPKIFDTYTEQSQADVFAEIIHMLVAEYKKIKKPIPYHVVARIVSRKVKAYEITTVISSLVSQQFMKEQETGLKIPGREGPKAFVPNEELLK